MIDRPDLNRIRKRWNDEKKISAADVQRLLDAADSALTMKAANDMRNSGRPNGLGDILRGFGVGS